MHLIFLAFSRTPKDRIVNNNGGYTGFARLTGNSQICGKNLNFREFRGNIFKFRGFFISTLVDLVQKAVIYI